MASEPIPPLDLGPLTWVRNEIDQALTRSLDSLAKFRADRDVVALKDARSHLHQAAGAIRMLDLDAVVEFTDEIERNLVHIETLEAPQVEAAGVVIERSYRKLSIFLRELAAGAPMAGLKLYPEYWAMQRLRDVQAATPTDLFYPDLRARVPRIAARETIAADKLPSYLAKKRRLFQGGLLSWLRGDGNGAQAMRDAVAGIEGVTSQDGLRSFWWTVRALIEALAGRGLESGHDVKQLAARIDLQIRRVVEGSGGAADRLRREVLYYVAISAPVGPTVRAVQRAFRLSTLIPAADAMNADVVGTEPLAREARALLAGVKETWLNFASGRAENLAKLKATLTSVHAKAAQMQHDALGKLTKALVEWLDRMPADAMPEPLAMEFTTALLLADSAFEHYASLSADFPQQVEAMLERLDAAGSGRPAPGDATILGELGKRAQERMLLVQVGYEVQANLRHMEEVLDAFFRDNSKRSELATLAKDSRQIHGALRILELDDADRLLTLCERQIEAYASPETEVSSEQLELLAESLCGLGFYFDAVEQQRPDGQRLIARLLARWLGETAPQAVEEAVSVESAVAALRAELPRLLAGAHRERSDPAACDELMRKLVSLQDDAALIGDEELALQAETAIAELERGGQDLEAAVNAIAETAAPAPQVSEETQRLLDVEATERDAGLLDIYLTEASKVLAAIAEGHGALARNAGDRDALRTVRRGFHTLKESSRMVALSELGELAGQVEKIHSRLLEEERPVTAAFVALIDTAQACFRGWLDELRRVGRVVSDPATLHAALRGVEDELKPIADALASPRSERALSLIDERPASHEATPPGAETGNADASKRAAIKHLRRVAVVQSIPGEALADVHDEIDDQLLANFLEEAAQLFPAAGDELRAWRRAPRDEGAAERLRSTLHTFKSSARMAGAMRLGQLTQVMESRLLASKHGVAASSELFDALETDLDLIAYVLEKLLAGESNVALPRLAPRSATESKSIEPLTEPIRETPTQPMADPPIVGSDAPSAPASRAPALKDDLLELANSVDRLRGQLREIEIQTDAQMRSRMTELWDLHGECDPTELESLTRVQDLTHLLTETLNGLAAVHESLLRNVNHADAVLLVQAPAVTVERME